MPAAARLYGFPPRASRYSCQSCSIVVWRAASHVRRVVGRVADGADDERALAVDVEDVDAGGRLLERAEEDAVAGQAPGSRIARLTAPCSTSSATSQLSSASSASSCGHRRGRAARRSSRRRGSACRAGRCRGTRRSSSPARPRARRRGARRSRSRAARGSPRSSRPGAIGARRLERARQAARDHAVEAHVAQRVRGRRRLRAARVGQQHVVRDARPGSSAPARGASGRCGVARAAVTARAATVRLRPACPRSSRRARRRRGSGRAARRAARRRPTCSSDAKSSPALQPCSALIAPPQTWKTWPVMFCASSAHSATTSGDMFDGSSGSKPSRRRAHVERVLGHARARVRREAVDRDAVALQLLRDDEREAGDAGLRRAVVRLADVAEDARRARRVDRRGP